MLDLILTSPKYANVTPLDGTGCGRRPGTYRRTCVCCFKRCRAVPATVLTVAMRRVCSQCPSSAFSNAFSTLSGGPARNNLFLVNVVETKRKAFFF